MIKLSDIKSNPNNPRLIKDDKFRKLVNSIKEFPKMMDLRPIIIDDENMVLGGNMRLKALTDLGYKELPSNWIIKAKDLTEEQKAEFIIKDNVGFGVWDWDILANEWNEIDLQDWGVDLPNAEKDINFDDIDSNQERGLNDKTHEVTCPECRHQFKA